MMYDTTEVMQPFDFSMINDSDDVELVESHEYKEDPSGMDDEDDLWDTDEEVSEDDEDISSKEAVTMLDGDLSSLDDEFEFTIGEEKLTKVELMERLNTVHVAKEKSEKLDTYFQNFKQIDEQMNHAFVASATENDLKLNHIRSKLRDPSITDSQRGQLYNEMSKLEGNKKVLDERVQGFFAAKEMREQQAEMVRLSQTNNVMSEKYGAKWVDNMAPAVTSYINESGIASPEMRKAISPAMIEVLIKAMKYDKMEKNGKEKVKAAVTRKPATSAPRSTASSSASGKKMTRSDAAYRKAVREGDNAALFNFIKD